jgi:KDO2-lipid IV(A) lauroyltransferase
MIKFLNYFIQAILIYIFFIFGRIFGLKISRQLFAFLFLKIGPLFKSNDIIKKNLKIFSENSLEQIDEKKIIEGMWKNYGMTFIEYVFLDHFRKDQSNLNIVDKADLSMITKNQKPVIFISGHFANFELMSMEITKRNISLATIYRPLNNFFLNPFMEYLRKKYVCKYQIKKGLAGVKKTFEYIKEKKSIALMIDQRVSEGEKINFFNTPALTTTLPSQLAIKFDINIIPVFIKRNKDDGFDIIFQERIDPKKFKDKIELSKKLNDILEKMIIENPAQWIWTHNRWK